MHPLVLKDSLTLIRILEGLNIEPSEHWKLTAANVNALYPSIQLDKGLAALRCFMEHHTNFNQTLKDLCLKLAYFVLTNNYVVCKDVGCAIHRQMIGTAMGTTFYVVYAIIFMIWLETPIVCDRRFSPYIRLHKRFIDDLFFSFGQALQRYCVTFGKPWPELIKMSAWTGADTNLNRTLLLTQIIWLGVTIVSTFWTLTYLCS